ncbi:MAG: hypothetical protein ACYDBQ_10910 [Thermoplasmatota archaeon]
MLRLLGRGVAGIGKLGVKYVIVPIAITAVLAAVLKSVADRLPEVDADPAVRRRPASGSNRGKRKA